MNTSSGNVSYNCLDRHIKANLGNKIALIWEGENGEQKTYTYAQVYLEVNKLANAIKSLGIKKGDRVAVYMPMVPEAVFAMLACARIGAVHVVVFSGLGAQALSDRIHGTHAKLLITADGGWRGGNIVALKAIADNALGQVSSIQDVIVLERCRNEVRMKAGRDHWYYDVIRNVKTYCEPLPMKNKDTFFIREFDLKLNDIFLSTEDAGLVSGNSCAVYGPLINVATQILYEGAPDFPKPDRFWRMIEKHKVSIFYTSSRDIDAFMKWGHQYPKEFNLGSLRLLGVEGQPISPEVRMWYDEHIGRRRCPIVDIHGM